MNKILVQYCNSKFIQNLSILQLDNTNIQSNIFDKQLYRLYFSYQPTHVVFSADKISEECAQFIEDYQDSTTIYAYHPNDQTLSLIPNYPASCFHLVPDSLRQSMPTNYNLDKVYYIPNDLINTAIYYRDDRPRSESIIYFAQKDISCLPDELVNVLYPNTKLPIKLFDIPRIPHSQNLGTLSESEKGEILRNNEYYLTYSSDEYLTEAIESGCKIVNFEDITNYKTKASVKDLVSTIKYQDFLQGVFDV
jgi:hypothetical protein